MQDRMSASQALSHAFITTYVESDILGKLRKAAKGKGVTKAYSRKNSSSSSEKGGLDKREVHSLDFSFYSFVCLFISCWVCLSVCLFGWLVGCLFVCLVVCLVGWLVVCLFICLFVCLFVCLLYSFSPSEKKSQIRPRRPSDPPPMGRVVHNSGKDDNFASAAGNATLMASSSAGNDAIDYKSSGTTKSLSSDKMKSNNKVSPGKDGGGSEKEKEKGSFGSSGGKFIFSNSISELKASRRLSSGAKDNQVNSANAVALSTNNSSTNTTNSSSSTTANTASNSLASAASSHTLLVDTTHAIEIDLRDELGAKFEVRYIYIYIYILQLFNLLFVAFFHFIRFPFSHSQEADVTGVVAETNNLLDDILGSLSHSNPSDLSNSAGPTRDKIKKGIGEENCVILSLFFILFVFSVAR
jgi:hypothetical protein